LIKKARKHWRIGSRYCRLYSDSKLTSICN